tara:strand:- start:103 stop:291 length:189 start_codon:yes stop_codon:yes gene_type:complete
MAYLLPDAVLTTVTAKLVVGRVARAVTEEFPWTVVDPTPPVAAMPVTPTFTPVPTTVEADPI